MKMKFGAWWLSAALALMGSAITPAMADEWNKETRLEISGPLEIPGKVLAPGTYIFKLADSQSDRNIVEIFSEDAIGRQKLVTTVLAISAYSVKTPDKPIIGLDERPSGSPQAIHNWFYPGDNFGWEFIYPKSDRLGVSASANQVAAEQPAPIPDVTPVVPDPQLEASVRQEPTVEPQVLERAESQPEETRVQASDRTADPQITADLTLPDTAGHSATELAAGGAVLALGLMTVLAGLRRAER